MPRTVIPPSAPCAFIAGFTYVVDLAPCPFHNHPAVEIVYHPTGAGTTSTIAGNSISFLAGDAVIYPAGQSHDQQLTTPGIDCCVQVRALPIHLAHLTTARRIPGPLPLWLAQELTDLAQAQVLANTTTRHVLDLRASAVLLALLEADHHNDQADQQPVEDPWERLADQAANLISKRFATLGRLEEVADLLRVGYDPLRRAFRRHRGMTMVAWLTSVRLTRAKELLAHSPMGQEAIARQCGYGSARYLNAIFRREAGIAPGRFRQPTGWSPADHQ